MTRGTWPPIAFLCHPYHRGGVTQWMTDAAQAWSKQGGPCWFVAPTPIPNSVTSTPRPTVIEVLQSEQQCGAPELATEIVSPQFEFGTAAYRAHVYSTLVRNSVPASVPIIVSDDNSVWQAAAMLSERNPMIGVLHADEKKYYELALRHRSNLYALVAVSHRVAETARSFVARDDVPISTIPCGIPMPTTMPDDREHHDVIRLAWVGRMEERQKRVTDIPRIVAVLRAAGLAVQLDVVGDGPDRDMFEDDVRSRGLDDIVRVHGWCERANVRTLLGDADILLLTSNFEGMPLVIMEALSAGCGVVATLTSGVEDFSSLEMGARCLWTYPVGDISGAVDRIMSAARVPVPERRARARRFAIDEFSIDRCIDRYRNVVDSLPAVPFHEPRFGTWRLLASRVASYPLARWRAARLRLSRG